MRHVEIEFDPDLTPAPGVLAWATFGDADFPEQYRLTLRLMTLDEADGGAAYVIEDTAGSDLQVAWTSAQALDRFLRVVAFQIEQWSDGDRPMTTADEWLMVAEGVRARVYGDDDNLARRARDRQAIRDFIVDGEPLVTDDLGPHVNDWLIHARETGYDRRRNLSVAGREDA